MRHPNKKTTVAVFLCLFFCCGCMSTKVVQKARGPETWHKKDDGKNASEHNDTKPAYYCLLPLTVPLDMVTSPIQAVMIFEASAMNSGWEH